MVLELGQLALGLVAVAFSTWIALPLGFHDILKGRYDAMQQKERDSHLKLLGDSQGRLFVAGMFFVYYFLIDSELSGYSLDLFLRNASPLIELEIFAFGLFALSWGLYDAYRAMNYSGPGSSANRGSLFMIVNSFNVVYLATEIIAILYLYNFELNGFRWAFVGLWFVLEALTIASALLLRKDFGSLAKTLKPKGILALVILVAPFLSIFVYLLQVSQYG